MAVASTSAAGNLTLTRATISGNSTSGDGGGIRIVGGGLVVTDSTLSGNVADVDGGGISKSSSTATGTIMIINSTISGNSAAGSFSRGGGIWNGGGPLLVTNSTFSVNSAPETMAAPSGMVRATSWRPRARSLKTRPKQWRGTVRDPPQHADYPHHRGRNTRGVAATPNDVSGRVTLFFSLLGVNTSATITDNGGNLVRHGGGANRSALRSAGGQRRADVHARTVGRQPCDQRGQPRGDGWRQRRLGVRPTGGSIHTGVWWADRYWSDRIAAGGIPAGRLQRQWRRGCGRLHPMA